MPTVIPIALKQWLITDCWGIFGGSRCFGKVGLLLQELILGLVAWGTDSFKDFSLGNGCAFNWSGSSAHVAACIVHAPKSHSHFVLHLVEKLLQPYVFGRISLIYALAI